MKINPQYITDSSGKKLVVLTQEEYDAIIEELEEAADVRLYEEAMKEDDGERILFSDYLTNRKQKHA